MPPKPEATSRLAARWMLAAPGRTLEAAAELHEITPQAVSRAASHLTGRARMGRPPSANPRRHTISTGLGNLRASDAEVRAWRRAARRLPLATWLRDLAREAGITRADQHLRRLARVAAGMPEE